MLNTSPKNSRINRLGLVLAASTIALLTQSGQAVDAKGIDWEKRLSKGYSELHLGNVDKAIELFGSDVQKHPESGAARTAYGIAMKKKGKIAEAKGEFRRATEVEPDFAESYYELGAICESDKEYCEAAKSFERYVQLAPTSNKRKTVEDRILFCRSNMP